MYFTSGSDRAFEQLMQGKPGFDHYDSGEAVTPEDCGTCRFYRPHWKYQFCVYAECPYQPGKLTAYDAVTFRVKGVENMAVFRVERNKGYMKRATGSSPPVCTSTGGPIPSWGRSCGMRPSPMSRNTCGSCCGRNRKAGRSLRLAISRPTSRRCMTA